MSKPPSKRVNYLKTGHLTPFSCPWESVLKLNCTVDQIQSNSNPSQFFILRNKRLLNKLSNLYFNKNKQLKLNFEFSEEDLNEINSSYIGVRLTNIGRGKIEKFSYIFLDVPEKEQETSNGNKEILIKKSINKIVNNSKLQILNEISNEHSKSIGTQSFKPTLNKLLKAKFNKNNILIDSKAFETQETYLYDLLNSEHQSPVGFVLNGGLTLLNGKYSANAFILGKALLNSIRNSQAKKYKNLTAMVTYKAPSSNLLKKAKVNNFFI
jgi:hypothetical protein